MMATGVAISVFLVPDRLIKSTVQILVQMPLLVHQQPSPRARRSTPNEASMGNTLRRRH